MDGSLYSNFTMATGAHGASISFPIAVTDGDLLETYFTSLGGNANECVYRIYDSQGNVANTGAGNPAYTGVGGTPSPTYFNTHLMFNIINGGAGYNSAPYSVGNPAPIITLSGGGCTVDTIYVNNVTFGTGIINSIISRYNGITNAATGCTSPPTITVTGGGGAGAIITATLVDDAVHVTCPATATYNYSWTNITSGGVAGLSNPNIQSPLATVSTLTQFQVTAYDSLHPLCIAIDTVTVNGNAGLGTFDFAITSTNPICNDGTVTTVDFSISSSTISSGNFTFDIVDGNGTIINPTPIPFNSIPFTGTINLPTPIVAGNYSYGITNVLDAIGCPVAVNQPNPITFIINDPPNAGTSGAITVCEDGAIFDLLSQLNGTPQMGGTWTNSLNVQVGAFYFPSTSPSDVFTYTLNGISPCPNDFSTVTVTNNALPDPGQNASHTVCQNDPAFNMENFLGGTPQTGGSWVDASGNSVSNGMFDPSTMSAGVYTYTVTGLSPCPNRSANLNVTVDALPTAAISTTTPTICDGNSATLNFTFTGTAPFDVTYNDGVNPSITTTINSTTGTATLNPTSTTVYTLVSVLDANGCSSAVSGSVTITVTPGPNAGTPGSRSTCESSPAFDLFLELGGTADVGGSWTESGNSVSNMFNPSTYGAGVFTLTYTITSPPCLPVSEDVTVTVNPLVSAGTNGSNIVCENDSNFNLFNFLNGSPDVGGSWVDASGNSVSNGMFDPSTMSAGVYTYTVTGLSPCPNRSANLNVTVDALPTAAISTTTPTICDGNSATLNFTFTGTAPFDVTYNDGVNPSITTTINSTTGTATLNPTSTTVYTLVSVLDANGCSSAVSGSVTITVTPGPNAGTPGSRSTCESSPAFDLFLELGGTADVGGSWTESGNSVSNMFNPSTYGAGVFTLTYTITSPPCLPVSEDVTVTVNPLVSAGTNGSNIVCENDPNFNLFNFLNGSPDVGGIWTDVNNIPVPNMFDQSTMSAGVYTYTVLGTPPCIDATATVTVTVNPLPTVTINGTTTITQGQSTPINFTFTGTAPYTVVYDDGTGPITSPSFNSNTGTINVSPNATTVYTLVSVTDANGCITNTSGSITITVNQLPTVTLSGTATICTGQNTDLDFNLGGSPNFTVEYNVNGVLTSYVFNSTGSNPLNVNPVITTTYTLVSITDGNGIIDNNVSGSVTITVNPLPTAVLSGDNTICDGTQTPLNFALTGAADYTLTYNPGNIAVSLDANGNDVSTGSPVIVNPTSTTSYSIVSIVDANTCTNIGSGSATITVNPLPNMQIIGTAAICAGQSATIGFTPTGTAPFNLNYLVNGTATNVTLDAAGTISGTPLSVTPSSTTTYTLVDVTDANCPNPVSGSITITVNPLPTATMSGSTSICIGQSTPLDFNFTGTGPYNINYDIDITPTSAVLSNNIDSIVVSPTSTTTYTLIDVTDANCTNSANGTVVVTVNPLPSANISGGATICADGSTAQIDITAAGTAPFNVIYSDGFNATPLNGISSPYNFQTNTAGNYTLISVTDFNGCDAVNISGVATVVVNPLPVASFSFMPQPIDINNPTVYFTDLSSGHVSGIYDFGDGITAPTVLLGQLQHTYIDTGSFQVLYSVTSADGCVASVGHTIIIDPAFLIYIPTGFTPNRDGKNDDFIPIMMGIDEYDFYIYDRFGELVFETENQLEGWNGRVNGREFALAGHYAYTVKIIDMLGKKRDFTGTLTLIR